tara:strand:- start:235 stop:456 length:222 start_codon:yes stop_codon:yes gene_type:complete
METFKTSAYQRKAYRDYIARKRDDPEFIEKRKQKQREYYQRNRQKILDKKKQKYQDTKNSLSPSDQSDHETSD